MTEEQQYEEAVEVMKKYLYSHRLRCTPERLQILRQICRYRNHFTAEQLEKDMQEQLHLSTATIYNTLQMLGTCGILRRLEAQPGMRFAEYEVVCGRTRSMRFVCTRCGREVTFKNKPIENILIDKRFSNFDMTSYSLNVYGTCKSCRRKIK